MTDSKTPPPIGNCATCGKPIWGKTTAARLKLLAHRGDGLCSSCHGRRRRQREAERNEAIRSGELVVELDALAKPTVDTSAWLDRPPLGRWREQAACAGSDDPRFFSHRTTNDVADRYCRHCPVIRDCRAEADAYSYDFMWGGIYETRGGRGRIITPAAVAAGLDQEPESA